MGETDYDELVETVIEENRYLTLATTDGEEPWAAPLEYVRDEDGTFYFFSTETSRHARHLERNETVAVAIFGPNQPEYSPGTSAVLNGVQIRGRAGRLAEDEYPDVVDSAIEALEPPMPPYAAFEIEPLRIYAPVIEDGVNERVEVDPT
jgi:uncharacterized protein YhbP (UPF0306 family)